MALALEITYAELWRARGEETRVLAEQMSDTHTRRVLLELADGYDRLVEKAEQRDKPAIALSR